MTQKSTSKSTIRKSTNEFLSGMEAFLIEGLTRDNEVSEDIATHLAHKAIDNVRHAYGGQTLYIPKGIVIEADRLHQKIFDEFNGCNHVELSKKYGVSHQWIYRVVKQVGAQRRAEG